MTYCMKKSTHDIPYIFLPCYNNVALGGDLLFCKFTLIKNRLFNPFSIRSHFLRLFKNPERFAELYGEGNERQPCVGDWVWHAK